MTCFIISIFVYPLKLPMSGIKMSSSAVMAKFGQSPSSTVT